MNESRMSTTSSWTGYNSFKRDIVGAVVSASNCGTVSLPSTSIGKPDSESKPGCDFVRIEPERKIARWVGGVRVAIENEAHCVAPWVRRRHRARGRRRWSGGPPEPPAARLAPVVRAADGARTRRPARGDSRLGRWEVEPRARIRLPRPSAALEDVSGLSSPSSCSDVGSLGVLAVLPGRNRILCGAALGDHRPGTPGSARGRGHAARCDR